MSSSRPTSWLSRCLNRWSVDRLPANIWCDPTEKFRSAFYGEVEISGLTTVEAKGKITEHLRRYLNDNVLRLELFDGNGNIIGRVKPRDTDRVFVDVASYNSKVYYVQGDVFNPGRLPITGNETVLDAMQHVGGPVFRDLSKAQSEVIRLSRTGVERLPVNLEAIVHGDVKTNYQLQPGDRLVIRRDPPISDQEMASQRLLLQLRTQQERIDKLEDKFDRILEKLDALAKPDKPSTPSAK